MWSIGPETYPIFRSPHSLILLSYFAHPYLPFTSRQRNQWLERANRKKRYIRKRSNKGDSNLFRLLIHSSPFFYIDTLPFYFFISHKYRNISFQFTIKLDKNFPKVKRVSNALSDILA